jgi:3,4-dihydroxy 2-butanone 4-phosphate synthase/GTP cyclohydrolase II
MITRVVGTVLPTEAGAVQALGYRDGTTGHEHLALVRGELGQAGRDGVLARVHSECLTGDALGSARCDCGPQLRASLSAVAQEGVGVVVYLRGHEGRGIGLLDKLRAYALQDLGADTVDANLRLGLPSDARAYGAAVGILRDLGVGEVRLLTNNPDKVDALRAGGIVVREQVPLLTAVTPANAFYLRTKMERFGHALAPILTSETSPAAHINDRRPAKV